MMTYGGVVVKKNEKEGVVSLLLALDYKIEWRRLEGQCNARCEDKSTYNE